MKTSVKMIKGSHLTAADKRNICEGIEYLRTTFLQLGQHNYKSQWIKRGKSPLSYNLDPSPKENGEYSLIIRQNEKNSYSKAITRERAFLIQVVGAEPLPMATSAQAHNAA